MHSQSKQLRLENLQYRLARSQRFLTALRQIEGRFPWFRLAGLLAGLLAAFLGFQLLPPIPAWGVVVLAVSGFLFLAVLHRRVIERITRVETFCHLLATAIARLNLDWERIPPPAVIPIRNEHPFASDLNLTGWRSLHQLLDTTVSQGGSQRLAAWLLCNDPDPRQIIRRQELVRELQKAPAFSTRLELNGLLAHPDRSPRWAADGLLRWLAAHTAASSLRPLLLVLAGLAVANITLFTLNSLGLIPPLWIGTLIIYFGIQSLKYRETSEVFGEAYDLANQLAQLRQILSDLEDYPYRPGSHLAGLTAPFSSGGQRPSALLRRVGLIASAASLRSNPFLSLALNILCPWDFFFAYQLERYKTDLQDILPTWLNLWYELEALTALANFAALNPDCPFPEILPAGSQPIFAAKGAGHPLILDDARVMNDFTFDRMGEIAIITGSNMSGKSTFLRTLGVNLVMAYAGGVVMAQQLKIVPMRLYTSMNLVDSLSDGISFFYAEVNRLKALLEQLDQGDADPLFFLIDEIFRGTNNRERQLGSQAYTQALAGKNGVGLISTHDLELAHLADATPWVSNFHFREDIHDGKMVFDYIIRPGASPTTNALRIMALAGLPVPHNLDRDQTSHYPQAGSNS